MTDYVRITPYTVQPKGRPSQALRWDGSTTLGEEIARNLNGRLIVWFVPRGRVHPLRADDETCDGTSEPFLVVYRSADTKPVRVDAGAWFVWCDDDVEILTNAEFANRYTITE